MDGPLHGGSDLFHREVISSSMGIFAVGSNEGTDLMYVGWHMKWSRHGTAVSQDNYTLQNRMKVLITEEGVTYAEEDRWKNELMYAEVDMRRNGMKGYSQDNYTKKVNNPDEGAYNYRDGKEVSKENEQSHFWKLVRNTNWLDMKFSRPARFGRRCRV